MTAAIIGLLFVETGFLMVFAGIVGFALIGTERRHFARIDSPMVTGGPYARPPRYRSAPKTNPRPRLSQEGHAAALMRQEEGRYVAQK
jgi:hypothetical protein